MSNKVPTEIKIRKLNAATVTRITQLAEDKGISREEYLRIHLESLSVLDDMKVLEMNYRHLVQEMGAVIQNNSEELAATRKTLEELK